MVAPVDRRFVVEDVRPAAVAAADIMVVAAVAAADIMAAAAEAIVVRRTECTRFSNVPRLEKQYG
jgi:hypothetical protein